MYSPMGAKRKWNLVILDNLISVYYTHIILLTYWPDPPLGQVPLMSRLFVLHRVGVKGQPAHVGRLNKPEVERGGGHPVQHGLRQM